MCDEDCPLCHGKDPACDLYLAGSTGETGLWVAFVGLAVLFAIVLG